MGLVPGLVPHGWSRTVGPTRLVPHGGPHGLVPLACSRSASTRRMIRYSGGPGHVAGDASARDPTFDPDRRRPIARHPGRLRRPTTLDGEAPLLQSVDELRDGAQTVQSQQVYQDVAQDRAARDQWRRSTGGFAGRSPPRGFGRGFPMVDLALSKSQSILAGSFRLCRSRAGGGGGRRRCRSKASVAVVGDVVVARGEAWRWWATSLSLKRWAMCRFVAPGGLYLRAATRRAGDTPGQHPQRMPAPSGGR